MNRGWPSRALNLPVDSDCFRDGAGLRVNNATLCEDTAGTIGIRHVFILGFLSAYLATIWRESCCCWVSPSCPTLCNPMTAAHQASLSFTISRSLLKLMSIESVMPSNHLILCHPFRLLPSIFPSLRVFSSESVLYIGWPKYWSFSFSISPSNEYSGDRLPENKTNEEQNRAEMKRDQTLLTLSAWNQSYLK